MVSDLLKPYNHAEFDPDVGPQSLLNKAQFDMRFYLCRRGCENFETMDRDTFVLQFDTDTHIAFVKKVKDELTENYKDLDDEITTGFMQQILAANGQPHKLYPVRSFENYISHLNSNCKSLWQEPLKKIKKDGPWYKKIPLGHNTLEKFLGRLSVKCDLSEYYTNHCIRVSGITNFKRGKFTDKQIMSVSSNKSFSSLAVYERVKDDEKLMMGFKLTFSLYIQMRLELSEL